MNVKILTCIAYFDTNFWLFSSFVFDQKLSLIPELPSLSSAEVEQQPMFDEAETRVRPVTARQTTDSNSNCYTCDDMRNNHSRNCSSNLNLQCVSFDESIADNTIIGDIISDYEDSDIELMQEALSLLNDDREEANIFCGNRCDLRHRGTVVKGDFPKESSDFSRFPARSFQLNHQSCIQENRPTIDAVGCSINSNVKIETPINLHPLSMPQVTFDEEEEFDRMTFFDHHERSLYGRSRNESNIPIVSPGSYNEPSQWLLRQIPSDASSNQRFDTPMGNAPKNRNKVDIRASFETKHKHWSKEEDKILVVAAEMEPIRPIEWIQIARDYFNNTRSATQCKNRWKNVRNA